jgi:uncharacterized protein YkwD
MPTTDTAAARRVQDILTSIESRRVLEARLMKRVRRPAALLAAALVIAPCVAHAQEAGGPDLRRATRLILEATNRFRAQEGRPMLKANDDLAHAAGYFANFMARTDKYGHEADGSRPAERLTKFGYEYSLVAENIAYMFNSAGFTTEGLTHAFMDGWKKSPPHRKNMLDPDLKEVGIAIAYSVRSGRYYAVQAFGRPKSDEIKFAVANPTESDVRLTLDDQPYTLGPRHTITFERGRPPVLRFSDNAEVFHPVNGGRYRVRLDAQGRPRLEQVRTGK